MVLDIITFPAKSLRNRCEDIKKIDDDIIKLINDMKDTLYVIKGYGLAAPQVGRSVRIIIIDETAGRVSKESAKAYINPTIIESSGELFEEEGCLSIPDEFAPVKRYQTVTIEALNEKGEKITLEITDRQATIFQHEIDHLNGILFIDKLASFRRETMKKHIKRRIQSGDYVVCE